MRGIYLVANRASEGLCANLIYSIRSSGCCLPITLIPFGGAPVGARAILDEVEVRPVESFPAEAHAFIDRLRAALPDCPEGFLRRFYAWFGECEEFLYSDNDVVALVNWERLFEFLPGCDVVHADEEYKTEGRFNYHQPTEVNRLFGPRALLSAFTAGHFLARRAARLSGDLEKAITWFHEHPGVPRRHDQALLHVASLLGAWKVLNLCRPPHGWLSSWAGDYASTLEVAQRLAGGALISHIHYSGGAVSLRAPVSDFTTASLRSPQRLRAYAAAACSDILHWDRARHILRRLRSRLAR